MTEKEIRRALEDIAEVRSSLRNSLEIIRPLLLDRAFAPFSLVCGTVIAAILVALHLALRHWGGFSLLPLQVRILFASAAVLTLAVSAFWKQRIITRGLRKQDRSLSVFDLLRYSEFTGIFGLVAWGSAILAGALLPACLSGTVDGWIFLPSAALWAGFIIGFFSFTLQVREYRILSVMSVAFGFACLFLMHSAGLLWLAAYVLVMLSAFSATILLARGNRITRE